MYQLYIDQTPLETRIALLRDEELCALHIDRASLGGNLSVENGNIYWGRVVNIVPALQACFIDIGCGSNGFLPAKSLGSDDISKTVTQGQYLFVQVRKEASEDKGPLLSAKLEIPTEHSVLTPLHPGLNVSRKFKDDEHREQLRQTLASRFGDDCGMVVRTAAEHIAEQTLIAEIEQALSVWNEKSALKPDRPALIHSQQNFIDNIWQQLAPLDIDEICVEGLDAYQQLKALAPSRDISLHAASSGLFEDNGVNALIDELRTEEVLLDGGGSIVVEPTRALIAIDVNMGKRAKNGDHDNLRLDLNLAALAEIKRQIDLRNLCGQILIDFVRLHNPKNRSRLLDACHATFKQDKRVNLYGFTKLGLLEMSRQRRGYSLHEIDQTTLTPCIALLNSLLYLPRCTKVYMGPRLFHLWQSPDMQAGLKFLEARLGRSHIWQEDNQLAPLSYKLEE